FGEVQFRPLDHLMDWPKPNTHDTNRKVIILRVGGAPVTNMGPPVTKTVTSTNSTSWKIITGCQKGQSLSPTNGVDCRNRVPIRTHDSAEKPFLSTGYG